MYYGKNVCEDKLMLNSEFFSFETERVIKLFHQYNADYDKQFEKIQKRVVYEKYGIGGETIHRGYFCPSLVIDIVIGNAKRGKLCNNIPKISKEYYKYGFDNEDHLILVTCEDEFKNTFEIIEHMPNYQMGIGYHRSFGIERISECRYDDLGRLTSYSWFLYNGFDDYIQEYETELYTYSENKLIVDRYNGLNIKKRKCFLNHYQHTFSLKNGYLDRYTTCDYMDGVSDPISYDFIHKVKIKRKIY